MPSSARSGPGIPKGTPTFPVPTDAGAPLGLIARPRTTPFRHSGRLGLDLRRSHPGEGRSAPEERRARRSVPEAQRKQQRRSGGSENEREGGLRNALMRDVDSGSAQLARKAVLPGAVRIDPDVDEPGNVGWLLDAWRQ